MPAVPAVPAAPRLSRPWLTVLDGFRLRQARRRHGLSRERLADRAGISLATVARLEREPWPRCHARTLARIAGALGEHTGAITPALTHAAAGDPGRPPAAGPEAAVRRPAGAAPEAGPGQPLPAGAVETARSRLAAELPGYHIDVERSGYRRPRYVATARQLDIHPYAVVSPDPAEVHAALGSQPGRGSMP